MTRGEALQKLGKPLGLPGLDGGEYLLSALFEAGPSEYHATGGEIGLTWLTLDAYARSTGTLSEPWEFRALREMSAAYIKAKNEGANIFCIPPTEQDQQGE